MSWLHFTVVIRDPGSFVLFPLPFTFLASSLKLVLSVVIRTGATVESLFYQWERDWLFPLWRPEQDFLHVSLVQIGFRVLFPEHWQRRWKYSNWLALIISSEIDVGISSNTPWDLIWINLSKYISKDCWFPEFQVSTSQSNYVHNQEDAEWSQHHHDNCFIREISV